jgi:hypothetical protein
MAYRRRANIELAKLTRGLRTAQVDSLGVRRSDACNLFGVRKFSPVPRLLLRHLPHHHPGRRHRPSPPSVLWSTASPRADEQTRRCLRSRRELNTALGRDGVLDEPRRQATRHLPCRRCRLLLGIPSGLCRGRDVTVAPRPFCWLPPAAAPAAFGGNPAVRNASCDCHQIREGHYRQRSS